MKPSLTFDKGKLIPQPKDINEKNILSMPTAHVVGDSIPQAYYRALRCVWEHGLAMRTQYDKKDDNGNYVDPPSRDISVLVEVRDPFAQPRYPPLSFCEIGVYIAELMGAKDHKVLPMDVLLKAKKTGGSLPESTWPYSYHQRLFAHPDINDDKTDQVAIATRLVAETPYTRRAMCSTVVPDVDPFMKEDIPCLREIQLRCTENPDGSLTFCPRSMWRSRDLYRAWGDNVIAITYMLQVQMREISRLTGKTVHFGSYADYSCSLHIYGECHSSIGGDVQRGLTSIFTTFPDEESFVARSLPSDLAAEMLVLPQLRELLTARKIAEWGLTEEEQAIVASIISDVESGSLIC